MRGSYSGLKKFSYNLFQSIKACFISLKTIFFTSFQTLIFFIKVFAFLWKVIGVKEFPKSNPNWYNCINGRVIYPFSKICLFVCFFIFNLLILFLLFLYILYVLFLCLFISFIAFLFYLFYFLPWKYITASKTDLAKVAETFKNKKSFSIPILSLVVNAFSTVT
jgi:hypothetical protein